MTVTALPPADPGKPRRYVPLDVLTFQPKDMTGRYVYGRRGERYRATPVRETATGLFTSIEVAK